MIALICFGIWIFFVIFCESKIAVKKIILWKNNLLSGLTPDQIFSYPQPWSRYVLPPRKALTIYSFNDKQPQP